MKLELNLSEVAQRLKGRVNAIQEADVILRETGLTLLAETKRRIFQEGLNSFGNRIGTYSEKYMATRHKYNWGPDRKVILTLTAQMRGDYTLIAVDRLTYGLGFQNKLNLSKMRKNEARFKAPIAALTEAEARLAVEIFTNRVNAILNGKP